MRGALGAALAVLALVASGCDSDDSGLVFKDPKGTINVERGMEFSLEFSVNAGVGYDWEPAGPTPPRLLELTKTDVDYPNPDRDGDSGNKRFTYRASGQAGHETLTFRQLFQDDEKERRTITVEIR